MATCTCDSGLGSDPHKRHCEVWKQAFVNHADGTQLTRAEADAIYRLRHLVGSYTHPSRANLAAIEILEDSLRTLRISLEYERISHEAHITELKALRAQATERT